jgi:hypothetical protein
MIIFEDKKSSSTSDLLSLPSESLGHDSLPSESCRSTSTTPCRLLPPPYATTSSGSSNGRSTAFSLSSLSLPSTSTGPVSTSSSRTNLPHRSNHLYITRPLGPIKGSWIIDTSIRLPAALLPPIEAGTTRKNLRFHAKMGKISARVEVRESVTPTRAETSESSSTSSLGDERAHLFFRSDTSSIKVRLVS